MPDQQRSDETPEPMPDPAGRVPEPPEPPSFRDWQHRLGPRNQPGSPTSPGGFLYLGMELPRPAKAPPPSPEEPPAE
jgi:hypothetical protein